MSSRPSPVSLTLICGITTKVLIANLLSRPQFFTVNSLSLEMCIQRPQDSELFLTSIPRVSGGPLAGTLLHLAFYSYPFSRTIASYLSSNTRRSF